MTGREPKSHNDLFYLCALIEYIARTTKNRNRVIVNALGEERLTKIYNLADIYHSDNIARVADDLIKECSIENDYFDITNVKYAVPTHGDIAKVYQLGMIGRYSLLNRSKSCCCSRLSCRQSRSCIR